MRRTLVLGLTASVSAMSLSHGAHAQATDAAQAIVLDGRAGGPVFEGIGVVDGGGATSVLLKDYPEPQRSQILDLLYTPRTGASVSALYVEVPGDGNSTQGSMPSHMHDRGDLNPYRGYTWWVMREARRRNPRVTLDGAAWSAPGWLGTKGKVFDQNSVEQFPGTFFSQDTVDYYVSWLETLRKVHGLEMGALGARNEKGVSYDFMIAMRRALDSRGFAKVRLHAFDNWQDDWKFDFVKDMRTNAPLRDSIDILGAHMNPPEYRVPQWVRAASKAMDKPIWNTEQHVYKPGYDGLISIVQAFNDNYVNNGVTKVVNWYGIAGVYTMEPFPGDKQAAVRASWPWSGHYSINPSLWGYAHYGQFSEVGWTYLNGGSGTLARGGTFVTLMSPAKDYSVILETKDAREAQTVTLSAGGGLARGDLAVWCSTEREHFIRRPDLAAKDGRFTLTMAPASVCSLTTTRGQRKGGFAGVPAKTAFPLPYGDDFDGYGDPARRGYLPRYFADIAGAFELSTCPGRGGTCLRQAVGTPPQSWAPNWQPYTIIGDDRWTDYAVAADVHLLAPGERGAVMGRVNEVGTGYGYIPKGYLLTLAADGTLTLSVSRGKVDKKALVGDATQQEIIRAARDEGPGGVLILATARPVTSAQGRWHRLSLRFKGTSIVGSLDGKPVLTVTDATYGTGMAGLLAGADETRWSRPWFDSVALTADGGPLPAKVAAPPLAPVLYPSARDAARGN